MVRANGLTRKTTAYILIGLGALIIALIPKTSYHSEDKKRYDAGISKIEELAEYDRISGTSSSEWRSVYNMLGLEYDPRNPKKLIQEQIDNYLERYGFYWEGEKYSNEILKDK